MTDGRDEQLRKRAYRKWEEEGRPEGHHDRHWQEAESEFANVESEKISGAEAAEPSPGDIEPKVGELPSANK